jgi:metal transporter CNNM
MHHDGNHSQKQITGVISLEDVLEAVIQDEIIDETDNFVDVNDGTTGVVQRGKHRCAPGNDSAFEASRRGVDVLGQARQGTSACAAPRSSPRTW